MRVELIYDNDCPNVKKARAQLLKAFAKVRHDARWTEWDRGDPLSPPHVRQFGSPTILIDGLDVAGESPSDGADCCRLYRLDEGGMAGVPPVSQIASRILDHSVVASGKTSRRSSWGNSLAVMPAIAIAFLPNLACPACWPAIRCNWRRRT